MKLWHKDIILVVTVEASGYFKETFISWALSGTFCVWRAKTSLPQQFLNAPSPQPHRHTDISTLWFWRKNPSTFFFYHSQILGLRSSSRGLHDLRKRVFSDVTNTKTHRQTLQLYDWIRAASKPISNEQIIFRGATNMQKVSFRLIKQCVSGANVNCFMLIPDKVVKKV